LTAFAIGFASSHHERARIRSVWPLKWSQMTASDRKDLHFPAGILHGHPTPTPPFLIAARKALGIPSLFEARCGHLTAEARFPLRFPGVRFGRG
jgi:hypothetical protein